MGQFTSWLHETLRTSSRNSEMKKLPAAWEQLEQRLMLDGIEWNGLETFLADESMFMDGIPAVAMDHDGDCLVAWNENYYGYNGGILTRFFGADGSASPIVRLVDSASATSIRHVDVAMDPEGDFILAWQQHVAYPEELFQVIAQRFDATGMAVGERIVVVSGDYGVNVPAVGVDAYGNFLVAWEDDFGKAGIAGQFFDSDGAAVGSQMLLADPVVDHWVKDPSLAMDIDGDFVLAWEQYGMDFLVKAQRFQADGSKIGPTWTLAPNGTDPGVAMDSFGNFAIAWNAEDNYYTNEHITVQRYDFNGTPVGTAEELASGMHPDIAMDATGEFVVSWQQYNHSGEGRSLLARRFNVYTVPAGAEFWVTAPNYQWEGHEEGGGNPVVAVDSAGNSLVAWQMDEAGWEGIAGQFYAADGDAVGPVYRLVSPISPFPVEPEGEHNNISLAMDDSGDFVLTWQRYDDYGMYHIVEAQLFNANGRAKDDPFLVTDMSPAMNPDVTMEGDGDFLVIWQRSEYGQHGIWGKRFSADGQAQTLDMLLIEPDQGYGSSTSAKVAMDDDGEFAIAWTEYYNVNVQWFAPGGTPASGKMEVLAGPFNRELGDVTMDADGDLLVTYTEGYDYGGIMLFHLTRYGQMTPPMELVNNTDRARSSFPAIAWDGASGQILLTWDVYSSGFNTHAVQMQNFELTGAPAGPRVWAAQDTEESGYEGAPRTSAAMDADGNTLVVWADGEYMGNGLSGRFLRADGTQSPLLQFVQGMQDSSPQAPSVAMDADGDFVLTWHEYDFYGGMRVVAQTFAADGTASSAKMLVAQSVEWESARNPVVDMDSDGDFVIAWKRGYYGEYGTFARSFTATGMPAGGEVQLLDGDMGQNLYDMDIALDDSGEFVLVWNAYDGYASRNNLFAQRFDASGMKIGNRLHVASGQDWSLMDPAVAMNGDGDILVVWQEFNDYHMSHTLLAQAFAPDGMPLIGATPLAVEYENFGLAPAVAMDDEGDFLVTWQPHDRYAMTTNVAVRRGTLELGLAEVLGDYTGDGLVNTVDYTTWADAFGWAGEPGGHPADGNSDGMVNTVDYTIWADHFGQDVMAPLVSVTGPVATNDPNPELGGTVSDPDAAIGVTINGVTYAAINNDEGAWTLPAEVILTLPDGFYDVQVTAVNGGPIGTANTQLTIDTVAPVVTVDPLITNDNTPDLTGTIDDATAQISVTVDGSTYTTDGGEVINNGDGTWILPGIVLAIPLADGVYEVDVTATDPVGNVGVDVTVDKLTIDTVAPVVTVDPLVTSDNTPEITGTISEISADIVVMVDGNAYVTGSGLVNNMDGTWTLPGSALLAPLADGVYDVAVTAIDPAGNVGSDFTVDELTVNTTPPLLLAGDSYLPAAMPSDEPVDLLAVTSLAAPV